ncbi:hypothetical protein Hanom_Chr09g00762411 [Helianthus anomalus]
MPSSYPGRHMSLPRLEPGTSGKRWVSVANWATPVGLLLGGWPGFLCAACVCFLESYILVMVFGAGGLTGGSLSIPRVEVRLAYIPPSPEPINSFAIDGIILGKVVVVVVLSKSQTKS